MIRRQQGAAQSLVLRRSAHPHHRSCPTPQWGCHRRQARGAQRQRRQGHQRRQGPQTTTAIARCNSHPTRTRLFSWTNQVLRRPLRGLWHRQGKWLRCLRRRRASLPRRRAVRHPKRRPAPPAARPRRRLPLYLLRPAQALPPLCQRPRQCLPVQALRRKCRHRNHRVLKAQIWIVCGSSKSSLRVSLWIRLMALTSVCVDRELEQRHSRQESHGLVCPPSWERSVMIGLQQGLCQRKAMKPR
mmetsp:Transcript_40641/g.106815  ORF Transcript_40641/g.106815 Transcript_40641/m.106815 type:complete len:243 (+) Transcript_40641:1668-2396(+)